jgi:hypothetical protein
MKPQLSDAHDVQVIKNFLAWAEQSEAGRIKLAEQPHVVLLSYVSALSRIHRRMQQRATGESKERARCKNHYYLFRALRLAYEYRHQITPQDIKTVSKLLREIYLCDGSLSSIFSLFLRQCEPHCRSAKSSERHKFVAHWRFTIIRHFYILYRSESNDDNTKALTFYLNCITPLSTDTRERGKRRFGLQHILHQPISLYGTTPLMAATAARDSGCVQTLLRFGANPLRTAGTRILLYFLILHPQLLNPNILSGYITYC